MIRDYASLSRLVEDGFVGMGLVTEDNTVVMRRCRIRKQEQVGPSDLDNYFSESSIFHRIYEASMKQQHVFQQFGDLTLVRDSYAYAVDLDEWCDYMERNGYVRLPDHLVKLEQEKTYEALLPEMSNQSDAPSK
jgi:hypothetical protein